MDKQEMERHLIGWKDKADFSEWGLQDIAVKIDTGAFTSSIHCRQVEVIEVNGVSTLQFYLLDPDHKHYSELPMQTTHFCQTVVKNSFGQEESRYLVETTIVLFGVSFPIDLTLSERGNMKYPVLLGRKMLKDRFIIDASLADRSFKSKKRNRIIQSAHQERISQGI